MDFGGGYAKRLAPVADFACQRVPAQQTFEKGHLDTAREA